MDIISDIFAIINDIYTHEKRIAEKVYNISTFTLGDEPVEIDHLSLNRLITQTLVDLQTLGYIDELYTELCFAASTFPEKDIPAVNYLIAVTASPIFTTGDEPFDKRLINPLAVFGLAYKVAKAKGFAERMDEVWKRFFE